VQQTVRAATSGRGRRTLHAGAHRRHHAHGLEAGVKRQPLLGLGGAAKVPARGARAGLAGRTAADIHPAAGAAKHGAQRQLAGRTVAGVMQRRARRRIAAGLHTSRNAGRSWGGAAARACLRCS